MMELLLQRLYLKLEYTIGRLSVDRKYFCDTLENRVRGPREPKVPGKTAIPAGRYEVIVCPSPHFKRDLPRLLNVPGFSGILIHRGNKVADTSGCILVGQNKKQGLLENSKIFELQLTALLKDVQQRGEKIFITIK